MRHCQCHVKNSRNNIEAQRLKVALTISATRRSGVEEILTELMDLRKGTKEYWSMSREVVKYMEKIHPEWEFVYHVSKDPVFGNWRGWKRKGVIDSNMDSGMI